MLKLRIQSFSRPLLTINKFISAIVQSDGHVLFPACEARLKLITVENLLQRPTIKRQNKSKHKLLLNNAL